VLAFNKIQDPGFFQMTATTQMFRILLTIAILFKVKHFSEVSNNLLDLLVMKQCIPWTTRICCFFLKAQKQKVTLFYFQAKLYLPFLYLKIEVSGLPST